MFKMFKKQKEPAARRTVTPTDEKAGPNCSESQDGHHEFHYTTESKMYGHCERCGMRDPVNRGYNEEEDFDPGQTDLIRLTIKPLSGPQFKVTVSKRNELTKVKEEIEKATGIPVNDQRLVWCGSQLVDQRSCDDYNIQNGALLHLIVRLRG